MSSGRVAWVRACVRVHADLMSVRQIRDKWWRWWGWWGCSVM